MGGGVVKKLPVKFPMASALLRLKDGLLEAIQRRVDAGEYEKIVVTQALEAMYTLGVAIGEGRLDFANLLKKELTLCERTLDAIAKFGYASAFISESNSDKGKMRVHIGTELDEKQRIEMGIDKLQNADNLGRNQDIIAYLKASSPKIGLWFEVGTYTTQTQNPVIILQSSDQFAIGYMTAAFRGGDPRQHHINMRLKIPISLQEEVFRSINSDPMFVYRIYQRLFSTFPSIKEPKLGSQVIVFNNDTPFEFPLPQPEPPK